MNDTLEIAKKCGAIDITQNDFYECYVGEIVFEPDQLQSFREEIEKLERQSTIASVNLILHSLPNTNEGYEVGIVKVKYEYGTLVDGPLWLTSDETNEILGQLIISDAEAIRKGDKP